MALYSFTCAECGKAFEKIVRMAAEPEAACPACGGIASKRGFDLPARTVGREVIASKAACPPGVGPCGTSGCRRGT